AAPLVPSRGEREGEGGRGVRRRRRPNCAFGQVVPPARGGGAGAGVRGVGGGVVVQPAGPAVGEDARGRERVAGEQGQAGAHQRQAHQGEGVVEEPAVLQAVQLHAHGLAARRAGRGGRRLAPFADGLPEVNGGQADQPGVTQPAAHGGGAAGQG